MRRQRKVHQIRRGDVLSFIDLPIRSIKTEHIYPLMEAASRSGRDPEEWFRRVLSHLVAQEEADA